MYLRVRWLAAIKAALVVGITGSTMEALSAGPGWHTSFEQAVETARREGKPIFVDFSTTWCHNCRLLEQQTFPSPEIDSRLQNFVRVQVDGDQRPDIVQKYNVDAYPTLVMLDPAGRMANKAVGFMKPRELAPTLDATLQQLGPSLQQARAQAQAQHQATLSAGSEKEEAPSAEEEAEAKPKGDERKLARTTPEGRLLKDAIEKNSKPGEPAREPAPKLASLEATKMPRRDAAVSSLLKAKPEGAEGLREPRLMAQASPTETGEVEELPKPLLRTTTSPGKQPARAATQQDAVEEKPASKGATSEKSAAKAEKTATPSPTKGAAESRSATATGGKDPLATIRKLQNSGKSDKAATTAAKLAAEEKPATAKPAPKEDADGIETPAADTATASATATGDKQEVTEEDVERWLKIADTKLINNVKKEARAMYEHVVDKDPQNRFGKSDMAFIKMVSLIVDDDDDAKRRKAYNKIKEFESRFPTSPHKDYYTLIRATLAADLGETNAAHKLLENFPDRFPDSKYQKLAYETWKSLPPVKKETTIKAESTAKSSSSKTSSSTSRNSDSKTKSTASNR